MIKSPYIKHGGVLAVFALITTGLIAVTYQATEAKIAEQVLAKRLAILNEVIPSSMHDNELYQDCLEVDAQVLGGKQRVYRSRLKEQVNGFAIETTSTQGYSGNIDMIVGVKTDFTVLGVRVLQHKETPGLGDKVELAVSDWILSFTNEEYNESTTNFWKVKKDGGKFDQFTGATITPRAVVNTAAATLQWTQENRDWLTSAPVNCEAEK